MQERIVILDSGSQYTQLIARRIRELNVYSEIVPFNQLPELDDSVKGVIFSGSPFSVRDENAPALPLKEVIGNKPLLGICYGAQYIAQHMGGAVEASNKREYGRAILNESTDNPLWNGISTSGSQVWMSHGDTITKLPTNFQLIGSTEDVECAAFANETDFDAPVYALQFHPEVTHSIEGMQILQNFVQGVCNCTGNWTPEAFVDSTVESLKKQIGSDNVVLGLSGGVDSSVAALLLHQAIGKQLFCVFVDNGLLRKNEFVDVLASYENMGLNVIGVDAQDAFLSELAGKSDPEDKRKTIGRVFIEVFEREAKKIDAQLDGKAVKWLAQGTIYPDVIESVSVHGPSVTIKSHHNVGGLPEKLGLKIVEPLRALFKDEVRRVGAALSLDPNILHRHPFPGPGLAIRILGDITAEKVRILQEADAIFINGLKKHQLYLDVWQAGVMLLPINSVGVMGDERTYEQVVALRAVASVDGMTADWVHLPYPFLAEISNEIINQVKGINRVVYDISSKPPATIEWE